MVRHLVMWDFQEGFPKEKKEAMAKEADARLKALIGQIPGLVSAEMRLDRLPTSTKELLLICDLDSAEALNVYQDHPLHRAVAAEVIRPAVRDRVCYDYEI